MSFLFEKQHKENYGLIRDPIEKLIPDLRKKKD